MSWFGFGGSGDKKKDDNNSSLSTNSLNIDDSAFDNSNTTEFASPLSGNGGGRSISGGSSFEQELMLEQQKALVQAVVFKLTVNT